MSKPSIKPPEWCLELIKTCIEINPTTGILVAKAKLNNKCKPGTTLGKSDGDGYLKLILKNNNETKHIRVHNIAWFLYYDEWPTFIVDHHDGNGSNNRKDNLRESDSYKNSWNRNVKNNNVGHRGVRRCERKMPNGTVHIYYQPRIFVKGKRLSLGNFKTMDAAIAARIEGEKKYFGSFALSNR